MSLEIFGELSGIIHGKTWSVLYITVSNLFLVLFVKTN